MRKPISISPGDRFGRLTAVGPATNKKRGRCWLWRCDCGTEKVVVVSDVAAGGRTRSCGCLKREVSAERMRRTRRTHGKSRTPEWRSWNGMIRRCYNPNVKDFKNYGGRGISVCDRWRNSFLAFYLELARDRLPNIPLTALTTMETTNPATCAGQHDPNKC